MNTLFSFSDSNTSAHSTAKASLFCDGGSRGNPGKSAGGAVLFDENKKEISRIGTFYGIQTNNFAEYHALIDGLTMAIEKKITTLHVFMDSNLAIEQMKGNWKIKNMNIKPLFQKAKHLCEKFQTISFTHIPREKNSIADSIVNKVLDKN